MLPELRPYIHGPVASCALQNAFFSRFRAPRRSPASKLQRQLQPCGVDSLQSAVLASSQLKAPPGAIRRGVATSAATGLTGTWKKDKAASDPMDAACDAVALSWVLRKALGVLSTLEVEERDPNGCFTTRIKAGGVMDVVEHYPWSGDVVLHKRRDKRRGQHRGSVLRMPEGGCIHVEWDNPYGGVCDDTFSVSEGGQCLTQATHMQMLTGDLVSYKTVYRRAG